MAKKSAKGGYPPIIRKIISGNKIPQKCGGYDPKTKISQIKRFFSSVLFSSISRLFWSIINYYYHEYEYYQKMWNLSGARSHCLDSHPGWTIPAELWHTGQFYHFFIKNLNLHGVWVKNTRRAVTHGEYLSTISEHLDKDPNLDNTWGGQYLQSCDTWVSPITSSSIFANKNLNFNGV